MAVVSGRRDLAGMAAGVAVVARSRRRQGGGMRMSAVRSIPVANDDYTVKVLGNVVEVWCVSEESGFTIPACDLEALIDGLLRAYIDTGQVRVE